jgi:membrane-bound metal-dependent hydrolase YbcI (DUF457 family)
MPVFGHAFVGLGAAQYTKPKVNDSAGATAWVAIALILSYLPDVICQICLFFGMRSVETIAHSLSAAFVLSLIAAAGIAALARLSFYRAFVISLSLILAHDLLDFIHFTKRYILWPFSTWRPNAEYLLPMLTITEEVIVFGSLYLASMLVYRLLFNKQDSRARQKTETQQHYLLWLSRTAVIMILFCAGITQYLRNDRIKLFYQARTMILSPEINLDMYVRALDLLDRSDRWPYGVERASVEYFKARAYWGLGNYLMAEQQYLAALADDPQSFNALGDIALLYASGREGPAARRRRAEPYIKQLRAYHATRHDIKGYLKKIDAALGLTAGAGYAAGIAGTADKHRVMQ